MEYHFANSRVREMDRIIEDVLKTYVRKHGTKMTPGAARTISRQLGHRLSLMLLGMPFKQSLSVEEVRTAFGGKASS
jgi:hypothetical protein